MLPTGPSVVTVLDGLGVPIGVHARNAAGLQRCFPTSHRTAVVTVDGVDEADSVSGFTAAAVEHTDLLGFHACVVSSARGAIVIPGRSGLGKSTLAAALTMAGFGYLSDEVCAVERASGQYRSFPRPLTLDATSLSVLALHQYAADIGITGEIALDPRVLGRCGPEVGDLGGLVIAERDADPGAPVVIDDGRPADAAAALIEACFNHFRWPQSALATITHLARSVPVLRVRYGHAAELAAALAARFGIAT